jgi:beta-lactam-binding protein with PASTA domain
MAEPPPRDPREPVEPTEDETVVRDEWEEPAGEVFVERTEEAVPPPRRPPLLWPGLLALLVLVLGGLAAAYVLTRDDEDDAAATTSATTTSATTTSTQEVSVPDVVGTTSSQATQTLTGAGLDVNLVAVPSDAPSGQVVAQNPTAGSEVAEGSTVRLNVAEARPAPSATTTKTTTESATTTADTTTTAPSEPATVPEVVGQELADAARAFADEGLTVSLRYVPSNEAVGRVVAQAQPAGTQQRRGDTVQLNVSIGAQPAAAASVPDVAGRRNAQARQALEAAGFEVLALNLDGEVRNESLVASQTPPARASIPRGSLVVLYLTG